MKIVDSHCHIDRVDLNVFGGSVERMIEHAESLSVGRFLCVCIDLENFPAVLSLAQNYEAIDASVGVHPTSENIEEPDVETLVKLAENPEIVAIGETGLDYFRIEKKDADWQRARFKIHIQAAKKSAKPLIIHTRCAREDTIKILAKERAERGVMHCFSEDWETAKAALNLGFYISFSGIITFKNAAALREVAKKIPLNRLLVETDAPYLTPEPHRGAANSPAYTYFVAQKLAEIRGETIEKIADATTENFADLFLS